MISHFSGVKLHPQFYYMEAQCKRISIKLFCINYLWTDVHMRGTTFSSFSLLEYLAWAKTWRHDRDGGRKTTWVCARPFRWQVGETCFIQMVMGALIQGDSPHLANCTTEVKSLLSPLHLPQTDTSSCGFSICVPASLWSHLAYPIHPEHTHTHTQWHSMGGSIHLLNHKVMWKADRVP